MFFGQRAHSVLLLISLALFGGVTTGWSGQSPASPDSGIVWFPATPLFPTLVADGTHPQLSVAKDMTSRRIIGSIGGVQRFAQWTLAGAPIQLGLGATVYGSFIKTPSVLDVVTVDFFVDMPIDIQLSDRISLRTGWGHYSAHLADDGVERLHATSINYAKDYIPLLASLTLPDAGGFIYGGTRFDYYTIPERKKHFVLQAGLEAGTTHVISGVRIYAAVDIKARAEVAYATTQSFQLGARVLTRGSSAIRFAYTYRTGIDDRGQFYKDRTSVSLLGAYFDY